MALMGVAEAARLLGVSVPRVHQRIRDGSLRAEKVGAQWVIDEAALLPVRESRVAGRPLSQRSAWALVAASESRRPAADVSAWLAPVELSRARQRLRRLLDEAAAEPQLTEATVNALAVSLRSLLRNRAERRLYRASPRDLGELRGDSRLTLSGLNDERCGISAGDLVEGYVAADHADAVVEDYLLSHAVSDREANVVLHVAPTMNLPRAEVAPCLLLAADLAEHRRPREEARAAELLLDLHRHGDGDTVRSSGCGVMK